MNEMSELTPEQQRIKEAVNEALVSRDINELTNAIKNLDHKVESGFLGVHERQDQTNGKVLKNEQENAALKSQFSYNRIIWYLLTTAVGAIMYLLK